MATTQASVTETQTATTTSLTPVQFTALSLAAVTGVIHLYLFVTDSWLPFLLAGVGFLGAIGLFLALPRFRRVIYAAGVLFTLAQIVGYLLFPMGPVWLAVVDKVVQVALIVVLAYLFVAPVGRGTEPPEAAAGVEA